MVKDTSKDYDDMVSFEAKETYKSNILTLLENKEPEKTLEILKPPKDPEFQEDWQNLYVNFKCEQDYIEFMKLINETPNKKLNTLVYTPNKTTGILTFFGDD